MIPHVHLSIGREEQRAVQDVLQSKSLAQGELISLFEHRFAQFCNVKYAIAVSSGTAALQIALQAHGIGPGDEVITTAFSFVASANAILLVGATPVFVDIDPVTYTLDPEQVEAAITPSTKALLPVHLYGCPCAMHRLTQLAASYSLALIEDACQAHGAMLDGQSVGSFGTGCFSFYATKNMTTGEGGMITTNDQTLAEKARLWHNHGQTARYVQSAMGTNLRMTELQGAIGLVQLEKLERLTEKRRGNAAFLTHALKTYMTTPCAPAAYHHVYHQYTIRVSAHRDEWADRLHAQGVETAIHYPLPIHQQPFYKQHMSLFRIVSPWEKSPREGSHSVISLPATERASQEVLSLPVHPGLSEEDLSTIVREVIALCA